VVNSCAAGHNPNMTTPLEILNYLLPFVATAGDYSADIQSRVGAHKAKDGATAFHHALSDADLSIQSYLEVALLARYPMVSFFSEEQDSSLNVKYFPKKAQLEVLLDPIDGTRSYIDNRPHYQVIVTIHDEHEIVGALSYMPRLDTCYIATRGEGAVRLTHKEVRTGGSGTKLTLGKASGPILVFNQPDLVQKLSPDFEVRDIVEEYSRQPGRYNFTDFLEGSAIATINIPCQAIDGGALSFIAKEAGAIVSDGAGHPVGNYRGSSKRTVPCVVTSSSPQQHALILRAMGQSGR